MSNFIGTLKNVFEKVFMFFVVVITLIALVLGVMIFHFNHFVEENSHCYIKGQEECILEFHRKN